MPDGDAPASDATSNPLPPGHPLADMTSSDEGEVTTPPPTDTADEAPDYEKQLREALADAEKWKALSKKNEALARTNKAAADEHRRQVEAGMSDAEKAIAEAHRKGRLEAKLEAATEVVEATFKAAAKDRLAPKSIDTLLGTIDRRSFMDEEGNVDTDAIVAFVEGIAPPPAKQDESKDERWPDLGQGQQGTTPLNASGLEKALQQVVNRG